MIEFVFLALLSLAQDQGSAGGSTLHRAENISAAPVELAGCKPSTGTLAEESAAKVAAEKLALSKEEVLARLIYSESLSTGYWKGKCIATSGEALMENIGWGVMNRVHRSAPGSDAIIETVFQKNQFRTSFSGKKENPFAEAFLCPLKSTPYLKDAKDAKASVLFAQAQKIADRIVRDFEATGIPASKKGITNFFYPKSEFFGEIRPAWAKSGNPEKNKGFLEELSGSNNPCVEFYNLK